MDPFDIEEKDEGLYPDGANSGPTENMSATAHEDSVQVRENTIFSREILERIRFYLDDEDIESFKLASKELNRVSGSSDEAELKRKLNILFEGDLALRDHASSQFMQFLSKNKIYPSYKEQLYWFDFILFLNRGMSISCEGVELTRSTTGTTIFTLSKKFTNRVVEKQRFPDGNNKLTYYINGVESRENGPSSIITNSANGNVEQEWYQHAGHFRSPEDGPGSVTFDEGKKLAEFYYINDMESSDGSFPSCVTWHGNGALNTIKYCKEGGAYVDREMIVRECWRPNGTLNFRTENMLFRGEYWLNKTSCFYIDGTLRRDEYKKMGPHGHYVLHREDGPAVTIYHAGGGVTTQFWLDGRQQQ